jgi:transposase
MMGIDDRDGRGRIVLAVRAAGGIKKIPRKFVAAAEGGDARANAAVAWVGQLYAIERGLPPLLPLADDPVAQRQRRQREEQRRQQRQQQAEPVLAELKKRLEEEKGQVLPKSALGQAVG